MAVRRIEKLLVANRGEIARRVMRTCRELGIATVAVFSDADADVPHVRDADEAVRIGPAPSSESYLAIDRIVAAAKKTGASAIHPGYGFLSENAAFAEAVIAAGLVFVGPTPDAIRAMGSKREAKRIATAAGVPVIPGYDGADQTDSVLAAKAREVGLPVLLKASSGGGGKGMRVVRDAAELAHAIESARREAESSFGDGTLLVESYIERPRHVEIQILGDHHGNAVHLFERECSIQRRHQKIVEESPSPALTPELRAAMGDAAVRLARAIGYTNAGTVEMILGEGGRAFYFLEVNTRLQVEHPVTELVTGIDLVREQIRIAEGEPLGYAQSDLHASGHAIECRLYAEDPEAGFLPQSGRIVDFHLPPATGLRVDAGVEAGTDVSIHYDPMLAKIVTHGGSRDESVRRMVRALASLSVQGVRTNRDFLLHVLRHPAFAAGDLHTHFIEAHLGYVLAREPDVELVRRAAVAATLHAHEARRAAQPPPRVPSGFRLSRFAPQRVEYEIGGRVVEVAYVAHEERRFDLTVGGEAGQVTLASASGPDLTIEEADGVRRRFRVVRDGAQVHVASEAGYATLAERPRFPETESAIPKGGCIAPMPGKIVTVSVREGDSVDAGQVLLVMEAMKMEHAVRAPEAGVVGQVLVEPGQQVDAERLLVVVEPR